MLQSRLRLRRGIFAELRYLSSFHQPDLDAILTKLPIVPKTPLHPSSSSTSLPSYQSPYFDSKKVGMSSVFGIQDPIGNSSRAFHPATIRAFKRYRSSVPSHQKESDPVKKDIFKVFKDTESILLYMNNRMHKYLRFDTPIERKGRNIASLILSILNESSSSSSLTPEELHICCAALVIGRPKDVQIWRDLDTAFHTFLKKNESSLSPFPLQDILLPAYAFFYPLQHYSFQFESETSVFVKEKIEQHLNSVAAEAVHEDAYFPSSSSSSRPFFQSIGGDLKAYHSEAIEICSLVMAIVSSSSNKIRTSKEEMEEGIYNAPDSPIRLISDVESKELISSKLRSSLSQYLRHTLTALSFPVKFDSLQYLWTPLSKVKVDEGYTIYKLLFELVLNSVLAEPGQVTNQEESIYSVLECMKAVEFRHPQLIKALCSEYFSDPSIQHKHSVEIFNSLVALDCEGLAHKLLLQIMDKAIRSSTNRFSALDISEKSKCKIFQFLNAPKPSFEYADFILSLHSFSRGGTREQYKLFSVIEESFVNKIRSNATANDITLTEAFGILHSYALVGRKNSELFNALDSIFLANISQLGLIRLNRILWCFARLNYKGGDYSQELLSLVINQLFSLLSASKRMESSMSPVLMIWSLAVLRELTIEVS